MTDFRKISSTTCIATVVSDPFVFGALVMLQSLMKSNPWFSGTLLVLYEPENSPLSEVNRKLLLRHLPTVKFRSIDRAGYEKVFEFAESVVNTPARLRAAFYILECFKLVEYDRVITLDSDMVVLGDLSQLFEISDSFSVVRAFDHDRGLPHPYFNTGTMVIHGEMLRKDMVEDIVSSLDGVSVNRDHGKADQAVLNVFFKNREKNYLDERFNFSKRLVPKECSSPEDFLSENDVRVLHFLGEKPWNLKSKETEWDYRKLEELWYRYFLRYTNNEAKMRLIRELLSQERLVRTAISRKFLKAAGAKRVAKTVELALSKRIYTQTVSQLGDEPIEAAAELAS